MSERYKRHIQLPGFGQVAQDRLANGSVLVIGAGGLGCPALLYLVAAGVGKMGIVDGDVVSLSNLQRQVLYRTDDIGKSKSATAKRHLSALNNEVDIDIYDAFLNVTNALEIISGYDLVIDASDNFLVRYLINDACLILNKPFIHGSIHHFQGQVSVFNYKGGPSYDQLFPEPDDVVLNCSEEGVIGVLPGIIGTLQATEAVKIIAECGEVLSGKLLIYDALNSSFQTIQIPDFGKSEVPEQLKIRDWFCNSTHQFEITSHDVSMMKKDSFIQIDIREEWEVVSGESLNMPIDKLMETDLSVYGKSNIILECETGKRSLAAAIHLSSIHPELNFFSLKKN